jgi:hypothetical protein
VIGEFPAITDFPSSFRVLKANPTLLRQSAKQLNITNATELDDFDKGHDREVLLTKWFRGAEWKTRQLVHDHMKIPLKEDLGILVQVRNCIVHSLSKNRFEGSAPWTIVNAIAAMAES